MTTSFFPNITGVILQSNLDKAFAHIIDLITLSGSEQYKSKPVLLSSLRKTIIILTSAIIEALLLWKFKQIVPQQKIELDNEWIYTDMKILYKIDNSTEITGGIRRKEKKDVNDLDFNRLIDKCFKHHIIKSKRFYTDIHKVRQFRNRLHIGNLAEIEREYTIADLEFCFKILEGVKINTSK